MQEELVICLLNEDTKISDIYGGLESVIHDYGEFEKCLCIVTGGAKAMIDNNSGLIGLLEKNGVHCQTLNCITHLEALWAKMVQASDVMKKAVQIVNLVGAGNNAHRRRRFIAFLEYINQNSVTYHCIQMLDSLVLQHFFGF